MDGEAHLLFPLFVGAFKAEKHEEYKQAFYKVLPNHCAVNEAGGMYAGEGSGKVYVHTDPALEPLFRFISDAVRAYMDRLAFDHSRVDIHFVKTWVNAVDNETVLPAHIHATSHFSFCYYIDIPENSDAIAFQVPHSPNEPFPTAFLPDIARQKSLLLESNMLNATQNAIPVQEGKVLIFPSTAYHGTMKMGDMGSATRLSIAGDILLVYNEEAPNYATGLFNPATWRCFK